MTTSTGEVVATEPTDTTVLQSRVHGYTTTTNMADGSTVTTEHRSDGSVTRTINPAPSSAPQALDPVVMQKQVPSGPIYSTFSQQDRDLQQ